VKHLQATLPDSTVFTHLNIGPTTPLLEIRRIAFDLHDQPVELRISQCVTGAFVCACSLN
jgi:DNA-binding GntR family transcriptional regulator